jgi:hypothetical protein
VGGNPIRPGSVNVSRRYRNLRHVNKIIIIIIPK